MQEVLRDTAERMGWDIDFAVPLLVETDSGDNWDEAHWSWAERMKALNDDYRQRSPIYG